MRSTDETLPRALRSAPQRGAGPGGAPGGRRGPLRGTRRRARGLLVTLVVLGLLAGGGWAWWQGSIGTVPLREHCTATASGGRTQLDPVQAGNAAVIAAVAVRRGLPGRAATIGIATAIQESKLENINYGDRDSLGLFQQRPSQGWGTAVQVRDPVYASNAFYDVLVKVEGYESLPITRAAQQVQRSAYPSAYADHEPEARLLASSLTGHSPGGFSCVLRAPGDLAAERPGTDGLTLRARAVSGAAARETGRAATAVRSDPTGTTLRWTLPGTESPRLGWALASWAVARAEGLQITEVQTAGRQWRRDRPDLDWTPSTGDPVPAGQVVVRVAPGG